jgi:uncharacterized protein YjdB
MKQKISGLYLMIFAVMVLFSAPAAFAATSVDLGEAGKFAVLSKAAITNVPLSIITGEVGISPAAGSFITGLTCPEVTGSTSFPIHVPSGASRPCDVVDPSYLTTVIGNMQTAYTAAQAQPNGVGPFLNLGGGTLIAQTLNPGVYTWGSNVLVTDDLTLDCLGNSSAVFVFQILSGGKLEISAGKKIILAGNCQAENIFWAVEGLTNLLAGAHLEGTVLGSPATSEITLITGATVNGRLLGEKTIALDQNIVTIPISSITPVLTTIAVSPSPANIIGAGSTLQLSATHLDQFGNSIPAVISYNSSNPSVATVSSTGLVTAVAVGTATITAASGAVSGSSVITVTALPPPPIIIVPGGSGGTGGSPCTIIRYGMSSPVSVDATAGRATIPVTLHYIGTTCSGIVNVTAVVPAGWTATSASTELLGKGNPNETVYVTVTMPSNAVTSNVILTGTVLRMDYTYTTSTIVNVAQQPSAPAPQTPPMPPVVVTPPVTDQVPAAQPDYTIPVIAVIILAVLACLVYMATKKKGKK